MRVMEHLGVREEGGSIQVDMLPSVQTWENQKDLFFVCKQIDWGANN